MNEQRVRMIRERMHDALAVQQLEVVDESHLHAGHAGARDGRGHFRVLVVSDAFADKSPLQRHRLIYEAMGDAMETDIHALTIQAMTPQEYQQASSG
ncbi:MAG: BolA family transcriptional regulator [Ectothiorhodospiraceae bacterium]|nr:BolA family transcriptional regulator [Ectothiorhodospiraceae bacterium]